MNATPPSYNERELLYDLATGMTYDDFASLYGMDAVQTDTVVADLQHEYGIDRRKVEDEWRWVLAEPLEVLLEDE